MNATHRILKKTTFSENKDTGFICISDQEIERILSKEVSVIHVYEPEYADLKAVIHDPIDALHYLKKSPSGQYYLMDYTGYTEKDN